MIAATGALFWPEILKNEGFWVQKGCSRGGGGYPQGGVSGASGVVIGTPEGGHRYPLGSLAGPFGVVTRTPGGGDRHPLGSLA